MGVSDGLDLRGGFSAQSLPVDPLPLKLALLPLRVGDQDRAAVVSLLVFASTVLVKQHFFVDIFAGIAVVEIAWFLSRRLRLWRVFEKIELPFVRRADTNLKKDG